MMPPTASVALLSVYSPVAPVALAPPPISSLSVIVTDPRVCVTVPSLAAWLPSIMLAAVTVASVSVSVPVP